MVASLPRRAVLLALCALASTGLVAGAPSVQILCAREPEPVEGPHGDFVVASCALPQLDTPVSANMMVYGPDGAQLVNLCGYVSVALAAMKPRQPHAAPSSLAPLPSPTDGPH